MADARPRRLAALTARLVDAQLDGLLVTNLANIRYLTGFSGSSGQLLVTKTDLVLLTDFRYQTQAAAEVGESGRVRIEMTNLWTGLWAEMSLATGLAVVGFETAHIPHRDFQKLLEDGAKWRWRPASDLVEGLREQKDDDEVERIRAAASIAVAALGATLPDVRVGMTELQVAGALEHHLRDAGSEDYPFATIVASGPRSALPHAKASRRAIAKGDFLLFDFGATVDGYCADVTRTVVVGHATDRQRDLYDAVRSANETARAGVHAGMQGMEADALARVVLEARGLGEAFGHGLGHGLGLEVHEAPRLSRISEAVLPVGAVVTIEPGAYVPEFGGVRIEDDVRLTQSGAELLTEFPRDLLEIG